MVVGVSRGSSELCDLVVDVHELVQAFTQYVDPRRLLWGAAFIVLSLIALNQSLLAMGLQNAIEIASHLEFMIMGALIVTFLILEPHGLARLWQIFKQKLRTWPFPYWVGQSCVRRPQSRLIAFRRFRAGSRLRSSPF